MVRFPTIENHSVTIAIRIVSSQITKKQSKIILATIAKNFETLNVKLCRIKINFHIHFY